jgi:hypothetical protein
MGRRAGTTAHERASHWRKKKDPALVFAILGAGTLNLTSGQLSEIPHLEYTSAAINSVFVDLRCEDNVRISITVRSEWASPKMVLTVLNLLSEFFLLRNSGGIETGNDNAVIGAINAGNTHILRKP